jgi:hypothetical protein
LTPSTAVMNKSTALSDGLAADKQAHAPPSLLDRPIFPSFLRHIADGIAQVREHNTRGHQSYLLGEVRNHGWWYYYPVALAVKTPLALLILGLGGFVILVRRSWRENEWRLAAPALAFAGILGFASAYSHINLGIRHVLILYPLLAIGAAATVHWAIRRRRIVGIGVLAVSGLAQLTSSLSAGPDNMTYFNAFAGRAPERILLTGDLDWGQDIDRVARELDRRNVECVGIVFVGNAVLSRHGLPKFNHVPPFTPQAGWIAASLWTRVRSGQAYLWLSLFEPVTRIGTSFDLYYIPESALGPDAPPGPCREYPGGDQAQR